MRATSLAFLFFGGLLLTSCAPLTGIEPTDTSVLKRAGATRTAVEDVLGEPIEQKHYEGYEVAIYQYDRGRDWELHDPNPYHERGPIVVFATLPFYLIHAADIEDEFIEEQRGYVAVSYSHNEQVVQYAFGNSRTMALNLAIETIDVTKKAQNGDPEAQYQIALRAKDPEDRKIWLKKAASQRHILAMVKLARGSNSGTVEEWYWLCQAAVNGHPTAQYEIGKIYESGKGGVSADPVLAYVWYSHAIANGYREPGTHYQKTDTGWECCFAEETPKEKIADSLSLNIEQLAEAEHLVAEWEPDPAQCDEIAAQADN